jgi:hypothetical protein
MRRSAKLRKADNALLYTGEQAQEKSRDDSNRWVEVLGDEAVRRTSPGFVRP